MQSSRLRNLWRHGRSWGRAGGLNRPSVAVWRIRASAPYKTYVLHPNLQGAPLTSLPPKAPSLQTGSPTQLKSPLPKTSWPHGSTRILPPSRFPCLAKLAGHNPNGVGWGEPTCACHGDPLFSQLRGSSPLCENLPGHQFWAEGRGGCCSGDWAEEAQVGGVLFLADESQLPRPLRSPRLPCLVLLDGGRFAGSSLKGRGCPPSAVWGASSCEIERWIPSKEAGR